MFHNISDIHSPPTLNFNIHSILFFLHCSNDVLQEISRNIRHMMEELWLNWSHLGVDDETKLNNITKLVLIEKELHRDVISETRQKLKIMQEQVDS